MQNVNHAQIKDLADWAAKAVMTVGPDITLSACTEKARREGKPYKYGTFLYFFTKAINKTERRG